MCDGIWHDLTSAVCRCMDNESLKHCNILRLPAWERIVLFIWRVISDETLRFSYHDVCHFGMMILCNAKNIHIIPNRSSHIINA